MTLKFETFKYNLINNFLYITIYILKFDTNLKLFIGISYFFYFFNKS